jgi:hypothetical protein
MKLSWWWAPIAGAVVGLLLGALFVFPNGHWDYGLGLLLFTPAAVGAVTTFVARSAGVAGVGKLVVLALGSIALDASSLVATATEGLACVAMALAVIAVPVLIGVCIGYFLKERSDRRKGPPTYMLLALVLLPTAWDELCIRGHVTHVSYSSSVIVAASPDRVWNEVIHLGTLPPAHDLMSLTGIACPETTQLKGQGVGAERDCRLSTGFMKERITSWEPGAKLGFIALETPPTMKEINPFGDPHPDHLSPDYFRIVSGEFSLERLPDGTTRLTRTTVYEHKIRPFIYWTWLSNIAADYAHHRVLDYVKAKAESQSLAAR